MKYKTLQETVKGFTLVELIITIALLSFGIIGIYGVFHPVSLVTANFSLHTTADYLTQEGIEIVENVRDNNILQNKVWSTGLSNCTAGCQLDYKTGTSLEAPMDALQAFSGAFLNINSDGFYSYGAGTPTRFQRKITITKPSASSTDVLKVDVLVIWNYNGKSFSFDTISYIYNL